jgi:hypothetical protein
VQAIKGGLMTPANAGAYVDALKLYVSANAKQLILNYPQWDAGKAKWYNEPWLGSIRESIHGTYAAGNFGPSVFPGTGLTSDFNTYVLTYYDERAVSTVYSFWGQNAMTPSFDTTKTQFPEGAVVVKLALFASNDPAKQKGWWPATVGAAEWPLFVPIPQPNPPLTGTPMVATGYAMQFDIIVKDTKSAPKTGWVFSTLVFDTNAPGDAWGKMVPLGAMWGNDPDVNSAANPNASLKENWINPKAPKYATQTLGWGGRLSGPNDGARNDIMVDTKPILGQANSSCLSCHSPAQWNVAAHKMPSFILPSYPNPNTGPNQPAFKPCGDQGQYICSPAPGSAEWMRWFQDRKGTQPMDAGSVAIDFDDVFAFKSLAHWWAATGPAGTPAPFLLRSGRTGRYNQYTGAPMRPK